MNILVMASTIKMGGAKTIYNQFMSHLPLYIGSDKYLIYVSEWLDRPQIQNVEYVIDKCANGAQRIWHEQRYLEEELRKKDFKPNWVVSLQNNGYKNIKGSRQIVYYHQALPLYDGCYNPFKRSERYLFYYKTVYPYVMQSTWAKDTIFVVQTPVVKERFLKKYDINKNNVHVFFPDLEKIEISCIEPYSWDDDNIHFLFIGDDAKYRNGNILVKAIHCIKKRNPNLIGRIKIHITNMRENMPILSSEVKKYGCEDFFIYEGRVPHEKLLQYYKGAAALLSPSVIETVGLPLLEAAYFGLPILVSDMDFSHYVLADYAGVSFIDPYNIECWAMHIEKILIDKQKFPSLNRNENTEWGLFFDLFLD